MEPDCEGNLIDPLCQGPMLRQHPEAIRDVAPIVVKPPRLVMSRHQPAIHVSDRLQIQPCEQLIKPGSFEHLIHIRIVHGSLVNSP